MMNSMDPAKHRAPPADIDVFRYSIDCLGVTGNNEAIDLLASVIDHPDTESRRLAMQAVLQLAVRHEVDKVSARVIEKLISNLSDSDANVRYIASDALTGLTGQKIGKLSPGGKGPPNTNDRQVRLKWENWWARNRAGFAP